MPVFPPSPLRSRIAGAFALAGLIALAACSADGTRGAFVDRRRDAGHSTLTYVGLSTPSRPSICYNSRTATPQQVVALARAVCAENGKVPVLKEQKSFDCRIFYPTRANFICVEPGEEMLMGAPR
ncbi:hypothetical protein [Oleispirillum naphthae]|uniref:hypothetical protein n=1 Tax=Oleispirillum naphthae TaxID=2838853 RepID=UPI0030826298